MAFKLTTRAICRYRNFHAPFCSRFARLPPPDFWPNLTRIVTPDGQGGLCVDSGLNVRQEFKSRRG